MSKVATKNLVNTSISESTASDYKADQEILDAKSGYAYYKSLDNVSAVVFHYGHLLSSLLYKNYPDVLDKTKTKPQFIESDERDHSNTDYNSIGDKYEWYSGIEEINKLDKVKELYNIFGQTDVINFLILNYYLVEILIEAQEQITNYFDEHELILELLIDPESETTEEQLILYILTDLPVEIAIEHRNKFDNNWWINNITHAKGNLCITLDYK